MHAPQLGVNMEIRANSSTKESREVAVVEEVSEEGEGSEAVTTTAVASCVTTITHRKGELFLTLN